MRTPTTRTGAAVALALLAGGLTLGVTPAATASGWERCASPAPSRQASFSRAAKVSGVPVRVLLGVSYLESRWDDHGNHPSTAGGYGPLHLTHVAATTKAHPGKGEGPTSTGGGTLDLAADLTGLDAALLRRDDTANICGGAAVLASYQRRLADGAAHASGAARALSAWSAAVAEYSGAADRGSATRFARQVFTAIEQGRSRTTNDGQRVTLPAAPAASLDTAAIAATGLTPPADDVVDCPAALGCESVPAPYERTGPDPTDYGNHDLADRPRDLSIDYIVIHDTEGSYDTALRLVTDPTYLAWHYTIRSSDGHIAEHVNNKNVGWQAGNWYVNMHSIGIEHEGYAAHGATWYTESMYESSAALVRHLAREYGVPLDRAHVIGHDQVPGVTPAYVRGMHWDPGPYWDWEHYMDLLGAPIHPDRRGRSDVVTVAPGFAENRQTVTGCEPDGTCAAQGTNFAYLHTEPSEASPLVTDIGLHPDGSPSSTYVSDIGARVAAGQKLMVAKRSGDWLGVWWLGDIAWLHDPADAPTVVPSQGRVVVAAGDASVPVYGRAYPEASAYPAEITPQAVVPLQYTIKPGQAYVLADADVSTDYYYAKTYDDSLPGDHTVVSGQDRYYEIWFGHRIAYVRAADVRVVDGVARLVG